MPGRGLKEPAGAGLNAQAAVGPNTGRARVLRLKREKPFS